MRKRERENPCGICGHYHKFEEGEVCSICGHRILASSEKLTPQPGVFPTEILPEFLYLGGYDNASRAELLKAQGISRILNTVPASQNLYKNSFTYHCLKEDERLQFDDAIQFLDQCEAEKARVLVHCMSGRNRSPCIVIAYLMKRKGWRLAESYQWVKDKRPSVDLSAEYHKQLEEYEHQIFGSRDVSLSSTIPLAPANFTFGFSAVNAPLAVPQFNQSSSTSVFSIEHISNNSPSGFTFGANKNSSSIPSNGADSPMDGS